MSDDSPDSMFGTLFREKVKPSVTNECELERVYVGKDKVCLDETDMTLNVAQVTSTFGSFVTIQSELYKTLPLLQFTSPN